MKRWETAAQVIRREVRIREGQGFHLVSEMGLDGLAVVDRYLRWLGMESCLAIICCFCLMHATACRRAEERERSGSSRSKATARLVPAKLNRGWIVCVGGKWAGHGANAIHLMRDSFSPPTHTSRTSCVVHPQPHPPLEK